MLSEFGWLDVPVDGADILNLGIVATSEEELDVIINVNKDVRLG